MHAGSKPFISADVNYNIHSFHTVESMLVILDVIFPPYSPPSRPCTYFKAEMIGDSGHTWRLSPSEAIAKTLRIQLLPKHSNPG